MASKDKLIPTALTIANNLHGTKYSTGGTFKLAGKKTSKWQNLYIDAVNFFASIYAKELKVANFNDVWDYRLVDGSVQKDVFTPDQNIHHLNLGMVVAFSENEWDELQITISKAFNIIYPFDIPSVVSLYTFTEITNLNALMGVFSGGSTLTKNLYNANGVLLGTYNQGVDYADAWNSVKVPADAALEVYTPFIAPIYQPAGANDFYYRYTGKRQWLSPFNGYDLVE